MPLDWDTYFSGVAEYPVRDKSNARLRNFVVGCFFANQLTQRTQGKVVSTARASLRSAVQKSA